MTDHDAILESQKYQEKILEKQSVQLENIEKSLVALAIQGKDIVHINGQIEAIWKKYDIAFGPDGTISKLQICVANCPKDELEKTLSRQWVVILFILTLIGALKLWG